MYVLPHVPHMVTAVKGRRTNADVVFDAVERAADRLPELIRSRRPAPATPPGGLFERPTTRPEAQRTLWTFRAAPGNIAVLDGLAARCGARSRSELVAAALEAMLPPPPGRQSQ